MRKLKAETFYTRLGKKIQEELKYREIHQYEMAEILHISGRTISQKLTGQTMLTIKELKIIADELLMTTDELINVAAGEQQDNKREENEW